jgi:hypothetical protein
MARPRTATRKIHWRIEPAAISLIQELADREGITAGLWISRAVPQLLQDQRRLITHELRSGLADGRVRFPQR